MAALHFGNVVVSARSPKRAASLKLLTVPHPGTLCFERAYAFARRGISIAGLATLKATQI